MLLSLPLNESNFYSHICSFHMLIKKRKKTVLLLRSCDWVEIRVIKKNFWYTQLSKLSSAFACAAVFALCFLSLWITSYNRRKSVKTNFLQQRIQAVFLKDYLTLVSRWIEKTHTWSTHGATSHMRLFWQTSPNKTTHQEFIYSHSTYCFCLDTVKDRIMLHKNNLSSHFALTAVILVWIQQDKSNVQLAFDSFMLKNYRKSLTYQTQLQYTSKGSSIDKKEYCILEVNLP